MQLDKLVNYHKAIGDPTRIRIISLLKKGPLHGQAIAYKLGLQPSTITHHISKLRNVGIIYQRRQGNIIYFYLDLERLEYNSKAILSMGEDSMENQENHLQDKDKLSIVKNFINSDGSLKIIPSQRKKKNVILAYLIRDLQHGKTYQEKELNEHIKKYHEDYATIRRELIMQHFMYRKNGEYELNPKEMWPVIF
ncbi:metalloregulator ArsR/SmtB family transcription factor [Priestia aryabhattai]|uniref:Metalloregulator ArsR/SmtB family transcription factor n=1 Tax=Priestia aryabhattai TaxID=412384 RepID=A0ABD7X0M8_PRIAR|nr:metalloregulator ArsR/SmtB family transcription factor [Priestia aryabhattai]WEA45937.1 metalloregulator ArsR/SmtB family transcription factor [Priestia aryabhattai]